MMEKKKYFVILPDFWLPFPVIFNFLFRMYSMDPESKDGKEALEMALHTLKMMARGGIHDHIAKVTFYYSDKK